MHIKYLFKLALITMCVFYSSLSFSKNENSTTIYDMPKDLLDFFETADACEGWISDFDARMEKTTYLIVEDAIKENCSNIEQNLSLMKNKYKNNKDYSERLTVYDDTVIIYDEYLKTKSGK
ncbi:hypothetical protein [Hafnia paralvei]|uniref:hypothetical protein n=1 Tax=Hafnia paralvei TaxID=546367 RepID=UPI000BB59270|nr:hypothetical protein [Hafnia paralvei]MCE9947988.1 hypothetical protein [Hafnia paralvei]NIH31307.1 hypothetical protein [Hafnia paralvei]PNK68322.1 hypothetical protein A6J69_015355 [Hafnia paralvei]